MTPNTTTMGGSVSPSRTHFIIGTRKSQLAMVQTEHVLSVLQQHHPNFTFELLPMSTTGDKVLDVALSKIGSKSLFTKELEVALHEKRCDLVVHSLKDMPTTLPDGMILGAILEREDPRDAVVMAPKYQNMTLKDLPAGSVLGTSSVRRCAQLKRRFPHLAFQDVRGNLNTRIAKLDAPDSPYAALLLAYAGLHRLNWDSRISEILNQDVILHAVGQGALGIECREGDDDVLTMLESLNHYETRIRCTAERAFMRTLEGGCSVPLGVWSQLDGKMLKMSGTVVSVDGQEEFIDHSDVEIPGALNASSLSREQLAADLEAAKQLGVKLAKVLLADGAGRVLDEIKKQRIVQESQ